VSVRKNVATGNLIWDGSRRGNLGKMEKVAMCVYRGDLKHFRGECVCVCICEREKNARS